MGIGIVIVSICIGYLRGAVYGWMFLGVSLIMAGLFFGMAKEDGDAD